MLMIPCNGVLTHSGLIYIDSIAKIRTGLRRVEQLCKNFVVEILLCGSQPRH